MAEVSFVKLPSDGFVVRCLGIGEITLNNMDTISW